jgi:acetyl-CoA carboxylase carboxyl transferase subunit alpha
VISPEGCAGILWKHVKHADAAARALRFTSRDLLRFGVIDEVIPEPLGGAHRDHRGMAVSLKGSLTKALRRLVNLPADKLLDRRYEKFRRIGVFEDQALDAAVEATPPERAAAQAQNESDNRADEAPRAAPAAHAAGRVRTSAR